MAARIAATTTSSGSCLLTRAFAPDALACVRVVGPSYRLRTTTANLAVSDPMSTAIVSPSRIGVDTSRMTTSGASGGHLCYCVLVVPASPITVMSASSSSRRRSTARVDDWSSTRNTVIMVVACIVIGPISEPKSALVPL